MKIQNGGEELAQEPSFYNYLLILMRYKYFIIISVFVALVGSVIVGAYLPEKYSATASIMPADTEKSIALLKSFNIRDVLIKRLGIEAPTLEDARHKFNRMVTIKKMAGDIVTITVEDTNPERAAKIANGMVTELNRFNMDSVMSAAKKARQYAEKRLEETRLDLEKAEAAHLKFEIDNKEFTLLNLTNVMAESAKGYLLDERAQSSKGPNRIKELKKELLGLRDMLVDMKVDRMKQQSELKAAPDYSKLMLKYTWLARDVQIKEAFYGVLSRQYQAAKMQASRYMPGIAVLDKAIVPQKKIGPNRTFIVEASVVAAFLFSVFMSFLIETVRRARCRLESI